MGAKSVSLNQAAAYCLIAVDWDQSRTQSIALIPLAWGPLFSVFVFFLDQDLHSEGFVYIS